MTADRTNATHWVYRCFDDSGRLLYVGSTTNLFNRLTAHASTSWWSPTIAKVRATVHPDGLTARAIERRAIRDEIPRWNKTGKWAGRARWTQDDWHDWITVQLRGSGGRPLTYMTASTSERGGGLRGPVPGRAPCASPHCHRAAREADRRS
jgi:predicted GIY-YIG superfamily endonuclease